jgi:hypothetical protein
MFKAFFIGNKLANNDEFDHLLHFYVWYRIAMAVQIILSQTRKGRILSRIWNKSLTPYL